MIRYWDGSRWTDMRLPRGRRRADRPEYRSGGTSAGAPSGPGAPDASDRVHDHVHLGALVSGRGPHYAVAPEVPGVAPVPYQDRVVLVTGEVPRAYDRVMVECEDGEAVEATILDTGAVGDVTLFVAPVTGRVTRIVATRDAGVYGIFLDVSLLDAVAERDAADSE